MPWDEFVDLAAGLRPDTALGRIVQIRAETDEEMLKHYTPEMRKIRSDWQRKAAKGKTEKETEKTRQSALDSGIFSGTCCFLLFRV